jgi:uncharacterized protein YndB with AHSA1/START domain
MLNEVAHSVVVPCPVEPVYDLWVDFEAYPTWMDHLVSVRKTGDRLSHWVMQKSDGRRAEWDVEHTVLRKNETLAWSSVTGDLLTYGSVDFEKVPGGTKLTWKRMHTTDTKQDASLLDGRFSDPDAKLKHDLDNFVKVLTRKLGLPSVSPSTGGARPAPTAGPQGAREPTLVRAPPKAAPPTTAGPPRGNPVPLPRAWGDRPPEERPNQRSSGFNRFAESRVR